MWLHLYNDVYISDVIQAKMEEQSCILVGTGYIDRIEKSAVLPFIPFKWEALTLPSGYYVKIITSSGTVGCMQGSTFNLPLEVAKIARDLL